MHPSIQVSDAASVRLISPSSLSLSSRATWKQAKNGEGGRPGLDARPVESSKASRPFRAQKTRPAQATRAGRPYHDEPTPPVPDSRDRALPGAEVAAS
ncbi:hypothetical protein ACQKWADRAFT_278799 [Trichoderma austrokoningii]